MFSRKELALFFLCALVISFFLYGNTFKNEFVWDDIFFTGRNELTQPDHLLKIWFESVIPSQTAAGLYRPFTVFTYALNLIIGGKNPFGFHLVSIVLNGIASFLVLVLAARLFRSRGVAIFSALFFAFLPIHTEAVDLMKARDEILGAIFVMLSWLFFLRATAHAERLKLGWLLGSAAFFLIGILSKEFVVLAPALFLGTYYLGNPNLPKKIFLRNLGWSILFFGALFSAYLWMRHLAIPATPFGNDEISPVSNVLVVAPLWPGGLLTPLKIAYIYISKTFVPLGLSATYHFKAVTLVLNFFYSWRAMLGLAFLTALIGFIIFRRTRNTAFGIGALSFLMLYFPFSQFLFKGGDIVAERWMYLPSIGLSFIVGGFFSFLFWKNRKFAVAVFLIILTFYTSVVIPRNRVWANIVSLGESMVSDAPKSVKGYSILAQEMLNRGDIPRARELISKGLLISNQEPNLYVLGALIFYREKRYEDAERLLLKAINLDTFSPAAVLNLPRVYFSQEKYEEAFWILDKAIAEFPPASIKFSDEVLYATILTKLGRYEESLTYLNASLISKLDHPDVKKLLAVNYYRLGKQDEALKYFDGNGAKTDEEKIKILEKF